jgi:hypothetical protein
MLLKIELLKGQSNMDNPEKLAKYGTQDEDKQNTICDTHHYGEPMSYLPPVVCRRAHVVFISCYL